MYRFLKIDSGLHIGVIDPTESQPVKLRLHLHCHDSNFFFRNLNNFKKTRGSYCQSNTPKSCSIKVWKTSNYHISRYSKMVYLIYSGVREQSIINKGVIMVKLFCFQYTTWLCIPCGVSAQGVLFKKATGCPTSDNMTDSIEVRSCLSCASLCSGQPECLAFSFSKWESTCNMRISDECHNIFTNGSSCTNEYDLYCRGMQGVLFDYHIK